MAKYEIGWHESHYKEIEADNWDEAEKIVIGLTDAREESVESYEGLFGDICIWEVIPDTEVSEDIIFDNSIYSHGYIILDETSEGL